MNLRRRTHLLLTALPRAMHRRGFGVQSPWAYELVCDVLFERQAYYAYKDYGLDTALERQLFRIRNHYRTQPLVVIDEKGFSAGERYERALERLTPDTVMVVEHIEDENAALWRDIVEDSRSVITFDMGRRGMVVFDNKRVKQNYLL